MEDGWEGLIHLVQGQEIPEFLGPAPNESNPLNHLPPSENLSSDNISLLFKDKILPALALTEKIFELNE